MDDRVPIRRWHDTLHVDRPRTVVASQRGWKPPINVKRLQENLAAHSSCSGHLGPVHGATLLSLMEFGEYGQLAPWEPPDEIEDPTAGSPFHRGLKLLAHLRTQQRNDERVLDTALNAYEYSRREQLEGVLQKQRAARVARSVQRGTAHRALLRSMLARAEEAASAGVDAQAETVRELAATYRSVATDEAPFLLTAERAKPGRRTFRQPAAAEWHHVSPSAAPPADAELHPPRPDTTASAPSDFAGGAAGGGGSGGLEGSASRPGTRGTLGGSSPRPHTSGSLGFGSGGVSPAGGLGSLASSLGANRYLPRGAGQTALDAGSTVRSLGKTRDALLFTAREDAIEAVTGRLPGGAGEGHGHAVQVAFNPFSVHNHYHHHRRHHVRLVAPLHPAHHVSSAHHGEALASDFAPVGRHRYPHHRHGLSDAHTGHGHALSHAGHGHEHSHAGHGHGSDGHGHGASVHTGLDCRGSIGSGAGAHGSLLGSSPSLRPGSQGRPGHASLFSGTVGSHGGGDAASDSGSSMSSGESSDSDDDADLAAGRSHSLFSAGLSPSVARGAARDASFAHGGRPRLSPTTSRISPSRPGAAGAAGDERTGRRAAHALSFGSASAGGPSASAGGSFLSERSGSEGHSHEEEPAYGQAHGGTAHGAAASQRAGAAGGSGSGSAASGSGGAPTTLLFSPMRTHDTIRGSAGEGEFGGYGGGGRPPWSEGEGAGGVGGAGTSGSSSGLLPTLQLGSPSHRGSPRPAMVQPPVSPRSSEGGAAWQGRKTPTLPPLSLRPTLGAACSTLSARDSAVLTALADGLAESYHAGAVSGRPTREGSRAVEGRRGTGRVLVADSPTAQRLLSGGLTAES